MKTVSALVATAFLATTTLAFAADPSQTDFDACNRMAQSKASPSASPQSSTSTSTTTQSSSSPGSAPQAAPSPQPAAEARVANQADQLRGIADASKDDLAYQQVYRDCMKGRGF
jgi:hypothetical protein